MADEDFGGFIEMAALLAASLLLDIAELIGGFLELAGEAPRRSPRVTHLCSVRVTRCGNRIVV